MSALSWSVVGANALGGLAAVFVSSERAARRVAVLSASLALALAATLAALGGSGLDALSRLLVPLSTLLGWALVLAAPRRWATPAALGRLLASVALLSLAFSIRDARAFALLWAATLLPTYLDLRGRPGAASAARLFAIYAGASAVALGAGLVLLGLPLGRDARAVGLVAVLIAVFIRKATLPFHSWLAGVFAAAPPGPVLLQVAPMLGAYTLLRFAVPLFPELLGERSFFLGPLALATAAYAAALAFVQTELRRIVAWIVTSQSALVLVGLECPAGAGLTGGLVAWLSAAAAMTGLGLSAWMLEARFGPLDIRSPRGLYRRTRALALGFLLSGLSLVGFPGTAGFASTDLLLSAVLDAFPLTGLLLFFATALNGFTILRAYLRLFHGPPARGPELSLLPREWLALLVPLALVISQGLYPAPLVRLGSDAAEALLARGAPGE